MEVINLTVGAFHKTRLQVPNLGFTGVDAGFMRGADAAGSGVRRKKHPGIKAKATAASLQSSLLHTSTKTCHQALQGFVLTKGKDSL